MDKRRIRAVLQKPADQIGQQVAVRADRGINPVPGARIGAHQIVQHRAHSVQALKLKIAAFARHFEYRGHGMRIMRCELRVNPVGHRQKLGCQTQVRRIGRDLAREDRKARQAGHLRAFDFTVPIGPFHQPQRHLAVERPRQRIEPVDHPPGPLTIGLDHDAKAIPACQRRVGQSRLNDIQRQFQPVRLFGVDIQPYPRIRRGTGEFDKAWDQFVQHARVLRDLVSRMQRRKFDRYPRRIGDRGDRFLCQTRDRRSVSLEIGVGVGTRKRRLAQHVERMGDFGRLLAPPDRRVDGFAQHELLAQLFHRAAHGHPNDRLAQALYRAPQHAGDARMLVLAQHLAGQHQGPGRGVDQRRGRLPQVTPPVARCDLVLDQGVHGGCVGHPQKRLGQTHQRDSFIGRQPVFGQKDLHQPGRVVAAYRADQIGTARRSSRAGRGIGPVVRDQAVKNGGLVGQPVGRDQSADFVG